jgi:hypothetical protein
MNLHVHPTMAAILNRFAVHQVTEDRALVTVPGEGEIKQRPWEGDADQAGVAGFNRSEAARQADCVDGAPQTQGADLDACVEHWTLCGGDDPVQATLALRNIYAAVVGGVRVQR